MALLIADGARWALVVLFSLAALEKVTTLHSRAAAWHPIMLVSRFRREHASVLVAVSLVADVGALLLLAVRPKVGAALCIALIVIYSTAGVGMHAKAGDAGCRCFWKVMNTSARTGLIARNALLVASAALVLVGAPRVSMGGLAIGAGLLVLIGSSSRAIEYVMKSVRSRGRAGLMKGTVAGSPLASSVSTAEGGIGRGE